MDFKLSQAGGYELRPKMGEIDGFAESGPPIRIGLAVVMQNNRMRSTLKTQIESSRCYRKARLAWMSRASIRSCVRQVGVKLSLIQRYRGCTG